MNESILRRKSQSTIMPLTPHTAPHLDTHGPGPSTHDPAHALQHLIALNRDYRLMCLHMLERIEADLELNMQVCRDGICRGCH